MSRPPATHTNTPEGSTAMTTTAKLIRSEYRFDPPADVEPVAVSRPGRSGWVIAYIHPDGAELRIIVHSTAGFTATLSGSMLHEATGKPIRMTNLSKTWAPAGAYGNDDLAEAPQWVRDAVAEVSV